MTPGWPGVYRAYTPDAHQHVSSSHPEAGRNPNSAKGAWVCYSFDWNYIPKALFPTELEARRYAAETHCDAAFWPWGKFENITDREVSDASGV